MTVFDPLKDKISVFSETLNEIAETNSYTMALRTLMAGGAITLTPNQATGQMLIDAPNNYFTSVVADGVTISGNGTAASPLVSLIPPITLTPTSLASGTIETLYNTNFSARGGSGTGYTFAITTGTLPTGMSLSSSGDLSGTPLQFGSFHFTVTATDSWGFTGAVAYTLSLASIGLTINPTTLSHGVYGAAYTTTLTDINGTGGDTFSVSAGTLPPGITLSSTGAISGTPTAIGSWTFTVSTSDSAHDTGTINYTLVIVNNLAMSPSTLPSGSIGVSYSQVMSATGGTGTGYAFTLFSGTLPSGLSITSGHTISGIPTASGTSHFTLQLEDSAGNLLQQAFSLTVNTVSLTFSPTSLGDGSIGYGYGPVGISAQGGLGYGYTYSITSGNLPPGLGLSGNSISGTVIGTGTFYFTIHAVDGAGDSGSQAYSIYVPDITGGQWVYDGAPGVDGAWPVDVIQSASATGSFNVPQFNWIRFEVFGAGGGGGSGGWQFGGTGGQSNCGPCVAWGGVGGTGDQLGGAGGAGGAASGGNTYNINGQDGQWSNGINTGGNSGGYPDHGGGVGSFGGAFGGYPYGDVGGTPGGGGAGASPGGGGGYSCNVWSAGQMAPGTSVSYVAGGGGGGGDAGTTWNNGTGGGPGRVVITWA